VGRTFERSLLPGIADAVGSGRVRLDAIARWLQDIAYEDVIDSGFDEGGMWIVRRMRIRVAAFPRFGEPVTLRTFCSGLARFAAERRTSIVGATARVEAVAVWVWIDEQGKPARFPERFLGLYRESAGERRASVRLHHPDPPADAERTPWRFRAADEDVAGHVNNSHYWEPLEERLAGSELDSADFEIEHREPAQPGDAVIAAADGRLWIESPEGTPHASLGPA
jgi:acyl-ACP thioesterase